MVEPKSLEYRRNAHLLLAQQPNYFGNLPELGIPPVIEILKDTSFEEVTCVALNPATDVVEATIEVKRSTGYGGDTCGPGSREWVRFYVSYDEGATWLDVGLSSFTAHDIPDAQDCAGRLTKPLVYTVAHPLPDPRRRPCSKPVLPLVRAILSWQIVPPPGQPDWTPVWGNALDHHVQLRPSRLIIRDFLDVLGVKKVPPVFLPLLPELLPEPVPVPLALAEVARQSVKMEVPPHRFAADLIAGAASPAGVAQQHIVQLIDQFAEIEIDWVKAVAAYFENPGDTTYEELGCLGLDYNRDLLVATFTVKQGNGYGSGPCGTGSAEHVAFWVDYDNTCQWSYAGTAQLQVHNYDPIPSDGLHYWVAVPARLAEHYEGCKSPKVARVRAVLSWQTPPSTTDPYDIPRWGNAIETHIEVAPREPIGDGPDIRIIGGIPVGQIDTLSTGLTLPNAMFGEWQTNADRWNLARQCPFGGTITVNTPVPDSFSATGKQYRLLWRPYGSFSSGTPVTDPFVTTDGATTAVRLPDPSTGFTPYLSPAQNIFNVLGSWRTRGVVVDGRYEIRLEMAGGLGSTGWFVVRVDNTPPEADLTLTGGAPCNKATPGDKVSGTFHATDAYFGGYYLDTLPASLSPPAPAHSPLSTTVPVPSGTWELTTDGTWPQCGYVVQLHVLDRTIVDSVPWGYNHGYDDVGFCLGL